MTVAVTRGHVGDSWTERVDGAYFEAAARAMAHGFGSTPNEHLILVNLYPRHQSGRALERGDREGRHVPQRGTN